jgi:hypothetical protein
LKAEGNKMIPSKHDLTMTLALIAPPLDHSRCLADEALSRAEVDSHMKWLSSRAIRIVFIGAPVAGLNSGAVAEFVISFDFDRPAGASAPDYRKSRSSNVREAGG